MVTHYMEAYEELQMLRFRVTLGWHKLFALADKLSNEEVDSLPIPAAELQKIRSGKRQRAVTTDVDLPWLS